MMQACANLNSGSAAVARVRSRRSIGRSQRTMLRTQAAAQTSSAQAPKPKWAGDDLLSRLVNVVINSPLFGLLREGARARIRDTAERRGVPWQQRVFELEHSEVFAIKEEIEDKALQYPSYYTRAFHGYEEGNLSWLAALEAEPATDVMALLPYAKNEAALTGPAAQVRLRSSTLVAIRRFAAEHKLKEPKAILDAGCSVGICTRWLAGEYPSAQVIGMDLSPYMLAVAELRERQWEQRKAIQARGASPVVAEAAAVGADSIPGSAKRQRITYKHGMLEKSGLPNKSQDLVAVQFVIHECPEEITRQMIQEAKRLLRPGGILTFVDINPNSSAGRQMQPAVATLMKATEPWTDEYYFMDVEGAMSAAGFRGVVCEELDPRHRIIIGHC